MKIKILVTGGLGFIGSHFVKFALENGHEISVLDLSAEVPHILSEKNSCFEIYKGDIRNEVLVENLIANSDAIVHLAAILGVQRILSQTLESISTNIFGSEVVLRLASKHKKRILIASTSEVYGKNPRQPLSENDDRLVGSPQNIRWTYSDSKALEESMAQVYFQENQLPVTTVRFFNTVGPGQSGQYGMVLPRFVSKALIGSPLEVHGDGMQTRVFCNVSDAVRAIYDLLLNPSTIGEVFNVGGLGEIAIRDLAELVITELNSKSNIAFIPYSKAYGSGYEDMLRRVPDISKIRSAIGWEPQVNLRETIREVAKAFKEW